VRHDTYIPQCYELDFVRFKEKWGKLTSREMCYLIRKSLNTKRSKKKRKARKE